LNVDAIIYFSSMFLTAMLFELNHYPVVWFHLLIYFFLLFFNLFNFLLY
jgi:hypothetical protein